MSLGPGADIADIADVERRRLRAITTVDAAELDVLHCEDFRLCTPSGDVWDRDHYLGGLIDGSIDYRTFEPVTEIQVLVDEHLGVVRYR